MNSTTNNHPILGHLTPDPLGTLFQTDYLEFFSPLGIDGLAQELHQGRCLEILALKASQPGTGQFTAWIEQAKTHYQTIRILAVMNQRFAGSLPRFGFRPCIHIQPWGEPIDAFTWSKPT